MIAERKKRQKKILLPVLSLALIAWALGAHYLFDPWGFYWKVSDPEAKLRLSVVAAAEGYLGCSEADGSHQKIIELYNAHEPLAAGYEVQYTDSWCATFVSAAAIQEGLTDIVPTECSCERQIELFKALGRWEERDDAIPLPGDLIYYDWDQTKPGDALGWSDHVGIVVGTKWPFIKVIEGNRDDRVDYRILPIGWVQIRGFAKPDYAAKAAKMP